MCLLFPMQRYQVRYNNLVTWYQARKRCEQNGHNLVNLRTHREWNDLVSVSKHVKQFGGSYVIGLKRFDESAPDMYRNMWHWLDGTVALYVHIRRNAGGSIKYRNRATTDFGPELIPSHRTQRDFFEGYIC